jgi:hypothetical protein
MKSIITILFCFLLIAPTVFSQDSIDDRDKRWVVGWFQEEDVVIEGVSFGLYSHMNSFRNTTTNGIRAEILGCGIFTFIGGATEAELDSAYGESYYLDLDSKYSEKVNGLSISATGAVGYININGIGINGVGCILQKCNGLLISGMISYAKEHNGVLLSGIENTADRQNGLCITFGINRINTGKGLNLALITNKARNFDGVQISLYNKAKTGRLIQFGLINYIKDNPKGLRILPFINMRFKKGD